MMISEEVEEELLRNCLSVNQTSNRIGKMRGREARGACWSDKVQSVKRQETGEREVDVGVESTPDLPYCMSWQRALEDARQ